LAILDTASSYTTTDSLGRPVTEYRDDEEPTRDLEAELKRAEQMGNSPAMARLKRAIRNRDALEAEEEVPQTMEFDPLGHEGEEFSIKPTGKRKRKSQTPIGT
jgi:hypothetical protein